MGYGGSFSLEKPVDGQAAVAGNGTHIAFAAGNRTVVDVCYGGTDDGAPGIRDYDRHYYAAFVRDPDGNKIEFVTFSAD